MYNGIRKLDKFIRQEKEIYRLCRIQNSVKSYGINYHNRKYKIAALTDSITEEYENYRSLRQYLINLNIEVERTIDYIPLIKTY